MFSSSVLWANRIGKGSFTRNEAIGLIRHGLVSEYVLETQSWSSQLQFEYTYNVVGMPKFVTLLNGLI